MAVDQPGALEMYVPNIITFDSNSPRWVVIHKTAGFKTAQECAAFFGDLARNGQEVSSHYVVGQDGVVVQCVPESRGAGANCCLEGGHAPYLPNTNLNWLTISIEHIDPALDNSTPVTPLQFAASAQLVHDICKRHNIPMRAGDAAGGIIGHHDIAPLTRGHCPGNYPMDDLLAVLNAKNRSMPVVPNEYMKAAAAQEFNLMNRGVPFNPQTAIVATWLLAFYRNRSLGPALTQEYQSTDWAGKKITKMMFCNGRAEWDGTECKLFNSDGLVTLV